jgi:tetratricopeptide (TPR) repeat protein
MLAPLRELDRAVELDMDKQLDFRFALPRPPEGPLVELSAEEAEKVLLKRLEVEKTHPTEALWQLARFYQRSKQIEKGLECLRRVMAGMPDAEEKAGCALGMGQMMESAGDYQAAVRYYKEAFALEPLQTDVWYFINNNLGYSLNQLGRFAEGEQYCRKAIEVNPNRPNAFKNLGIALDGQGDFRGAAKCFIAATQANAADARAFHLLQDLLQRHPELEYEFQEAADCCRRAIEVVARKAAASQPVVYRGWRKHLILLGSKLRIVLRRVWPRSRN